MSQFTNPLDNIRIASPCSANWEEMFGDFRRRFCGDCKLNVYNLSGMTRQEAENLLITSEGRLCVRFFRRADGTVLTRNCPVGWKEAKQRVSRMATAVFSICAGFIGGVFGFGFFQRAAATPTMGAMVEKIPPSDRPIDSNSVMGIMVRPAVEVEPVEERGRYSVGKPEIRPRRPLTRKAR
ncbi:MAG: hypothetical protein ABR530_00240 [Pyrinomonadaceae bacterium]